MSSIYTIDVFETDYNHKPHHNLMQEYEKVTVKITETRTVEDNLYLKVPEHLIGKPMEFLGQFNGFPIFGYKEGDIEHTELIMSGPRTKEWGDGLMIKLQDVPQSERRWTLEYRGVCGFASEEDVYTYIRKRRTK